MGYILKNTSALINTKITDAARLKLAKGDFNIKYLIDLVIINIQILLSHIFDTDIVYWVILTLIYKNKYEATQINISHVQNIS